MSKWIAFGAAVIFASLVWSVAYENTHKDPKAQQISIITRDLSLTKDQKTQLINKIINCPCSDSVR